MQSTLSLKSLVLAVGLVLAAAAPSVFAGGHGGMQRGGFGGAHLMEALDDVGATEAQRQQIEQILRSSREEMRAQREQGMGLRQQMLQAFAAPSIDANAVESLRKQQMALHDQASQRMSRALVEAARVLTPEQRAKLTEKMSKRMERMQQRHGKHGRQS